MSEQPGRRAPTGGKAWVRALAVALALVPATGLAQLGLDLTQEPPAGGGQAPAAGFGMDLTSDTKDRRPTLGLLGLATQPDATDKEIAYAAKLTAALVSAAQKSKLYGAVVDPAEVKSRLGAKFAAAAQCRETACLAQVAEALEVDSLIASQLTREGVLKKITFVGHDRGKDKTSAQIVDETANPGDVFVKAVAAEYRKLLEELATPLGSIKIETTVAEAVTTVGDKVLGSGPFEKMLPAGKYQLVVSASGYSTVKKTVVLKPGDDVVVDGNLIANQVDDADLEVASRERQSRRGGPSLFSRPGVWLVLGGAAMGAAGAYFGMQAQQVQAQAVDSNQDGILDLTRSELLRGQTSAMLANVLVAAGAAAVGGGVLWVALGPTRRPMSVSASQGVDGWAFSLGGAF